MYQTYQVGVDGERGGEGGVTRWCGEDENQGRPLRKGNVPETYVTQEKDIGG